MCCQCQQSQSPNLFPQFAGNITTQLQLPYPSRRFPLMALIFWTLPQQSVLFLLALHFLCCPLFAQNIFSAPLLHAFSSQPTVNKFYSFFKMVAPLNSQRLCTLLNLSIQVKLYSFLVLYMYLYLQPEVLVCIPLCINFMNLLLLRNKLPSTQNNTLSLSHISLEQKSGWASVGSLLRIPQGLYHSVSQARLSSGGSGKIRFQSFLGCQQNSVSHAC